MPESDEFLLQAWQAGDRQAGDRLIARYMASIRRFFVNKVFDAEDVGDLVGQTFLGCTHSLEKIQSKSAFRGFLFGIANNVLRNYFRRRTKRSLEAKDFESICVQSLAPRSFSSILMEKQRCQAFVDALREVPINDQLVLELRYFMGYSGRQIADILGLPPATVRGQLMRARGRLQGCIETRLAAGNPRSDTVFDPGQLDRWSAEIRSRFAQEFGEVAAV